VVRIKDLTMKKFFQRVFKRIKIKFYKLTRNSGMQTYEEEAATYEKTCFKICLKLISHSDSEFMIAPMSGKKYIRNDKLSMFVTLDFGRVEITNHVFNYNVKLLNRDWERLTFIYDSETEKRRIAMEKEVSSNIKNSLEHVLDRISELTEKK
jgi:hypothetical protein